MKTVYFIISALTLIIPVCMSAQDHHTTSRRCLMAAQLAELAERDSAYNNSIDISVMDFPVADLLRGMAISNDLSIEMNIDREKTITCNVKSIPVKDILLMVCMEKSLDIGITGNIVSISDYTAPVKSPEIKFVLDSLESVLSFDFSGCRLDSVARRFNAVTGHNLLFPVSMSDRHVSGLGTSMKIGDAVLAIATINGLGVRQESITTWNIFEPDRKIPHRGFSSNRLQVDSSGMITAHLYNADIADIVPVVMDRLGKNYLIAENIGHNVNIDVDSLALAPFLNVLFSGTDISWKETEGVYVLGKDESRRYLSNVSVYPMKYRTVETVPEIIPSVLKNGMEIRPFPDLNCLVISGDIKKVGQIEAFLKQIDKSVPLISIDVMIVDASTNSSQTVGLGLGVGTGQETTGGTVSPGIDFSLNAESISRILGSFNGMGAINLGQVSGLFYADLQMLEEAGKIVLRSTPRLSTLNGHKAVLKSGEVKYYKESQVNIIGTQNPLQSESYLWKNVEADFILDITPYVSLDSTITMTINLSQDEFTATDQDDKYAPPGIATRSFNSIIKVKNREMVLLGGIEKNIRNNSSRGLPFIARVPVLRAIFGKTNKQKTDSRLNIFIRPTIL